MKQSRVLLAIMAILFGSAAFAQGDLVENGSFDVPKGKLKKMGSIEMAKSWVSPTANKADLFSDQLTDSPLGAERNQYGGQAPKAGNYYAGIRVYSANDREPRTYLQTTFTTPMTAGEKYCVKYHVSLADLSRFATGEVATYFSKEEGAKDESVNLTYEAQFPVQRTTTYNDLGEWQMVCGIYEADGGEQHMIIGNFTATKETTVAKIKKPKGEVKPQVQHGYYYIDDVSVTPIRYAADCKCGTVDMVKSEFIFGRSSFADGAASVSSKVDQQVFYFKRYQENVDTSMEPWVKELVELMTEEPGLTIRLIGHIDQMEKDRASERADLETMGERRAESIKKALEKNGIDASRMTTAAGEEYKDATSTEVGMSKNRRVEVEVAE